MLEKSDALSRHWLNIPVPYRYLIVTLPVIMICVGISITWIDRPLALWMMDIHQKIGLSKSLGLATTLTQLAYCLMLILLLLYFFLRLKNIQNYFMDCLYLFNQSVVFAYFFKMTLQYIFGRYVPRYSGSSTLLFVRNAKLYGFHWLQAGSFPSGHMTLLTAGLTAICLYYRRYLSISIFLWMVLASLLVLFNYHFLSDIIAGSYLGFTLTLGLFYLSRIERTQTL